MEAPQVEQKTPSEIQAIMQEINNDLDAVYKKHGVLSAMGLVELPFATINHEYNTGITKRLGMVQFMQRQSEGMLDQLLAPSRPRPSSIAPIR